MHHTTEISCRAGPGRAVPHHPRRHSGRHAVAKFPGSIKKKLCPGQPTGDLLKAIVDQREGYQGQRDPAILLRLRNLHQVASLTSSTTTAAGHIPGTQGDDTPFLGRVCRQCSRSSHDDVEFQKTLLVCSRCKSMYYCSRECQTETGRPTRRRAKKRAIPA